MWRATLSQLRSRSFCSISAGIISFTTSSQASWSLSEFLSLPKLLWEQALIPVAMLAVYWLSGYYNRPFERSRLNEFINTFYSALFNATLIFFILLINDRESVVSADYLLICVSFLLLLLFTYSGRLLITSSAFRRARKRISGIIFS